ncbi:MAG: hypothetical protein ACP5HK_06915 [Acidilobus sp.]
MSRLGAIGYALVGFSAGLGVLSYLYLLDRPLAFSMIGLLVLGLTMVAVDEPSRPTPYLSRASLEAFAYNAEALLEEADAAGRAIVTPPREGLSIAFVPLRDLQNPAPLSRALSDAPRRLSVAVGGVKGVELLIPAPPPPSSMSLETVIREAVVEGAEAAEAVRVEQRGGIYVIEAVRPMGPRLSRLDQSLGGVEGAIAAAALSRFINSPVYVLRSYATQDGIAIELGVG